MLKYYLLGKFRRRWRKEGAPLLCCSITGACEAKLVDHQIDIFHRYCHLLFEVSSMWERLLVDGIRACSLDPTPNQRCFKQNDRRRITPIFAVRYECRPPAGMANIAQASTVRGKAVNFDPAHFWALRKHRLIFSPTPEVCSSQVWHRRSVV